MPLTMTTITGPVYLPNGATPVGGRVSFELSSWDVEDDAGLVITGPVYVPIDENGQISVNLFTTSAGSESVTYRMFVIWEDSTLAQSYVNDIYVSTPVPHYTKKYIGSFVLSGPGPYSLSDLNIVSELNNSSFDAYLEMKAFADRIDLGALDSAMIATASDRVQTGLDRVAVNDAAAAVAANALATAADRVQTGLDVGLAEAARIAAETAASALEAAGYAVTEAFTPTDLTTITLPNATWVITDLYASGLPQFSPDDWEQVGGTLILKRGYHVGQEIRYRYRIAETDMLTTATLADGTASLPSLTFTNDLDTGVYRLGANILGFSAGGSERLRVSPSGAQVTGLLTGTAVTQSQTDTTPGRLLKVGDFGMGALNYGDLNPDATDLPTRFFRSNAIIPGFNVWGHIINLSRLPNGQGAQIALRDGNDGQVPLAAVRHRSGTGAWSSWNLLFGRLNILGPVSQSGGIPTGALFERGSNANGEFVRYADGTQICTFTGPGIDCNSATGAMFQTAAASTWTFPATFAAAPTVSGSAGSNVRWLAMGPPTTSAVSYRAMAPGSSSTAVAPTLTAIGRWF